MALMTIGTLATTTLLGAKYSYDPAVLSNADLASIANGIFQDLGAQGNVPGNIIPGALSRDGILQIPDRMQIKIASGDWVATDQFGSVFYIPRRALPTTLTLTGTTVSGSPTISALSGTTQAAGWQVGTRVTGTGIPVNSVIGKISVDGLSFTLATIAGVPVNATASNSGITITAGTWTHS